jgi:hypothetical protein
MIKRENKKGSHVEIIISFVIFVTFVFFIFSIIEPSIRIQGDKEGILNNIEFEIINRVSSPMTIITANLANGGGNCVDLNYLMSDLGIENNIIVRDDSGKIVNSNADGTSLQINRVSTSDTFFKIYYSQEFNELAGGSGCPSINYEYGLTKTNEYIFETKVLDLIDEDYETLKSDLKIPTGVEFGYGIKLSNGTVFETEGKELSTNVYVRETPIKYVDSEGNILMGFLKTEIW